MTYNLINITCYRIVRYTIKSTDKRIKSGLPLLDHDIIQKKSI